MKTLRLLYVLILIATIIVPLFPISPLQVRADGEAWLSGYSYRDQFTITGTADGAQTNYQLKFTVNRGAGANSGLTAYVNGKCDSTYKDIRFTKADGSTLLDYWIESSDASTATVWIEFDSIPANPTTIHFYFYYGNSSATSESNGTNTFPFFDDFPGASLDETTNWVKTGNVSVSGSVATIGATVGGTNIRSKTATFGTYRAVRAKVKSNADYNANMVMFSDVTFANLTVINRLTGSANYVTTSQKASVSDNGDTGLARDTNYHIFDIVRNASTSVIFTIDDANSVTAVTQIPTGNYYIWIRSWEATPVILADWILVRLRTTNEPTVTAWAAEEIGLPTVTTQATSSISFTTAIGNGNITATNTDNPNERGICVSSIHNPPTTADTLFRETGGSFGTGAYTENLTSLTANTTYYARAYAINSAGTAYGSTDTFATLVDIPTVTTQAATNLAITQAGVTSGTFNGNLTNLGDSASDDVNFEYGLTVAYGSATTPVAKNSTGAYTAAMPNNLTAGATYHYRAKATNAYGDGFGSDQTFVVPTPGGIGTTYYVAKTGNDSNSGTTLGNAWLTIQKAANTLQPGDTVFVKAGTYYEQVVPTRSGTSSAWISYKTYSSDLVVINGSGKDLGSSRSGSVQGLFYVNGKSFISVEGFSLTNSTAMGASIYGVSDNVILKNLKISETQSSGVFVSSIWNDASRQPTNITLDGLEVWNTNYSADLESVSFRQVSGFEIKNCKVHDVQGNASNPPFTRQCGITLAGSSNGLIHNNEVYKSYSNIYFGSSALSPSSNIKVYNNRTHDALDSGIAIGTEYAPFYPVTNIDIYNNLVYNNGLGFLADNYQTFSSTWRLVNNTFYFNGGDGARNIFIGLPAAYYQNCLISNNISVGQYSSSVLLQYDAYANGGVTIDHNLFYDASGYSLYNVYGTNFLQANPLFNGPPSDMSIPSNSPAKDVGSATGAPATDYIGTSRPQGASFDIGAYEFITGGPPVAPSITTSAATNVQSTTATLNGNVTATGSDNPTVTVYWGATDGGTTAGNWAFNSAPTSPAQPQGVNVFTYDAANLATNTTYYFRAKATNSAGTTWAASSLSFVTKTLSPTNVSATKGTLTDRVTITWTQPSGATGFYVYRGVTNISGLLGTVGTYDDMTAAVPVIVPGAGNASDGTNQSWVVLSVSGNSITTTSYSYTVVAVSAPGNSPASGASTGYIGAGTPTYQWQVSAGDSDAAYGNLAGATTSNYNDTSAPVDGSGRWYKVIENATGAVQATSTANRGYRSVGAAANAPTILTSVVSGIASTIATAGGNITDIGAANVTIRGVCYGLAAYPDTSGAKVVQTVGAPFGTGVFSLSITGLVPGVTYHVRAYAINTNGTSYGDDTSFTTSASTPMPPTTPSTLDVQGMAKAFFPLIFLGIVLWYGIKSLDKGDIGNLVIIGIIVLIAIGLLAGLYSALP